MSRVASAPRKKSSKVREIPAGPGRTIEVRAEPGQPQEVVRTVEIREFPPGVILRPRDTPVAVQVKRRIFCPFCRSDRVRRRFSGGGKDYYRCQRCVDETTGDYSAFIVPRAGS